MRHPLFVLAVVVVVAATVSAKLADRSRLVKHRAATGKISGYHDNGRPLEGQSYRSNAKRDSVPEIEKRLQRDREARSSSSSTRSAVSKPAPWKMEQQQQQQQPDNGKDGLRELTVKKDFFDAVASEYHAKNQGERELSSQLSGCCYNYKSYSASKLCSIYGNDCESGSTKSHDDGDGDCSQQGLSFIGISFSVNTASGNPYSYQLCDQFPMENIIDRDYEYVMSMDEDGWLVGGGYKTFDYSGKMPYVAKHTHTNIRLTCERFELISALTHIHTLSFLSTARLCSYIDSSHTELIRIGNMNPETGGTSINTVYSAMSSVDFAPFSIYPEYLKGGGGHHSGDSGSSEVQSSDITLIVSIVETYEDSSSYSSYEQFLDDLFDAMDAVGGGPCMDDHDTDPHVSMARGVKFWSAYHSKQYQYAANLEVAVWQSMYPKGVPIGSAGYAAFPPGRGGKKQLVGYGNVYFFFDRANITNAFAPYRSLTDTETYYATLYAKGDTSSYYASTTSVSSNYGGSNDGNSNWEWNPYSWNQKSAKHDMTGGWELPPNCFQEGETFFGIPLSRTSGSKLQSSMTFQEQFDFEYLVDRNGTYVTSFGTNHGWLIGEELDNAVGSIVDKDTAHIPIFYTGTTNANMVRTTYELLTTTGVALRELLSHSNKLACDSSTKRTGWYGAG
jgi:hypothetical protein